MESERRIKRLSGSVAHVCSAAARRRASELASGVGVRLVIICFRVSDPDNGTTDGGTDGGREGRAEPAGMALALGRRREGGERRRRRGKVVFPGSPAGRACERGEKWHCDAECARNAEWKRLIIAMPLFGLVAPLRGSEVIRIGTVWRESD